MERTLVKYLDKKGILSEFVKSWGVDDTFRWLFNFETLCENLNSNNPVRGIIALNELPFDRPEYMQLAAVLPRKDAVYYLNSDTNKGNMAFWTAENQLSYSCSNIPHYMKSINTNVQLEQLPQDALSSASTLIQEGAFLSQKAHQVRLSTAEFVPKPSAGIFVLVCHKDDLAGRILAAKYHDALSFEISNIQRKVQRDWSQYHDSELLGVYVDTDTNRNYHATAVSSNGDSLSYINHSQSSHLDFATAILQGNSQA